MNEIHEPAAPATDVFDEVAQAHKETAAKLELLASHCRPDSPDQADLLGRAEEARRLP
jgi:hypothetical protein